MQGQLASAQVNVEIEQNRANARQAEAQGEAAYVELTGTGRSDPGRGDRSRQRDRDRGARCRARHRVRSAEGGARRDRDRARRGGERGVGGSHHGRARGARHRRWRQHRGPRGHAHAHARRNGEGQRARARRRRARPRWMRRTPEAADRRRRARGRRRHERRADTAAGSVASRPMDASATEFPRSRPGPERERWVPLLELADEPEPLRAYLDEGSLYGLVGPDGAPCAAILVIEDPPGIAELRAVAVAEAVQGQGVGTLMVNATLFVLAQRGIAPGGRRDRELGDPPARLLPALRVPALARRARLLHAREGLPGRPHRERHPDPGHGVDGPRARVAVTGRRALAGPGPGTPSACPGRGARGSAAPRRPP